MIKECLPPALIWIVSILNKHQVSYQISGGFSCHLYGATRPVNDIDIDILEEDFEKIYEDVKEYLVVGPSFYKDERWDLYGMLLDYHGQEIDFSGMRTAKVFDDVLQTWIDISAETFDTETKSVFGIEVQVLNLKDVAYYKQFLSGDHQKTDIQAVQEYLKQKG